MMGIGKRRNGEGLSRGMIEDKAVMSIEREPQIRYMGESFCLLRLPKSE